VVHVQCKSSDCSYLVTNNLKPLVTDDVLGEPETKSLTMPVVASWRSVCRQRIVLSL
jgi:hypothetical protein